MIPIPVLGKRWRVSDLFKRRQGAWFEPRSGYMWQENTGATATTTGGQTIGKLVDLSADRVASQSTAANRPSLQFNGTLPLIRHADSTDVLVAAMPAINVRRNLLTWSESFDNGVWTKTTSRVVANSALAPDGTATADKLVEDTSSGSHQAYQARVLTADVYTLSFYAKAGERTHVTFTFDTGGNQWGYINLSTGSIAGSMPAAYTVNSIANVGNGWYRVSVSRTGTVATYYANFATANGAAVAYTGDGTSGVFIWGAQLELGSVATDYQKITDWTSEQYSSAGSVYFSTPQGMSCLHNQSIGTTYNLPALQTDIYGTVITPARLAPPLEQRLALYMHRLAGLADADFFWQEDYGPELVTNGDFSNGTTGWSTYAANISVVDGQLNIVSTDNYGEAYQSIPTTIGTTYKLEGTVRRGTAVVRTLRAQTAIATGNILNMDTTATGNVVLSGYFKAIGTSTLIGTTLGAGIGITGFADNISVRELKDGMVGQLLADDNDTILLRA